MTLPWDELVKERDEWVAKNFPPIEGEIPGSDSILGMVEEVGELAHAHLKGKQGIRGTAEEHEAAARDAIGDIIIYMLGVLSAHRHPILPTGIACYNDEDVLFKLGNEIGLLCNYRTRRGINPPVWSGCMSRVVYYCEAYCSKRGWDFEALVLDTWDHVKQRDWNAHRAEGASKNDPNMTDPIRVYPYPEGDTIVLGPECFVAKDGSVMSWKGQNYVPQKTNMGPYTGSLADVQKEPLDYDPQEHMP